MELDKESQEFNEKQKRLQEYSQTAGRHLSRIEDAVAKLERTIDKHMGFLIDTLLKWMEDEERRRDDEYRRSSYGMYDPFKYRTKRGHSDAPWEQWASDRMREPYRNPYTQDWRRDDPAPYDPEKDTDPDKDSDTAS